MTDIPIIFSGAMVRAWLAGTKSMTRRLLYSERKAKGGIIPASATALEGHPPPRVDLTKHIDTYYTLSGWQKVKPGDRLWVRENLTYDWKTSCWRYRADGVSLLGTVSRSELPRPTPDRWPLGVCNSIHMPREFSRLTLIVTATKIDRLQATTEEDAIAEGIHHASPPSPVNFWTDGVSTISSTPRGAFGGLWQHLHGIDSWNANPDVVAISATAIKANIDSLEKVAA